MRLQLVPALVWAGLIGASEVAVSPDVRFSYFSGYTYYEIEGADLSGSWRSRLKFPINNVRLDANLALTFSEVVEVSLGGFTTLDESAGTMLDDDYTNGVRDVWSRTNADLEAWGLQAHTTLWLLREPDFSLGPTLRAYYDRLDYDCYNVRQWSLDPLFNDVAIDGTVLTYRQERVSFPIGLALRWKPEPWFQLEWFGAVSFLTYVWDEDRHLLRDKVSESEGLAFALPTALNLDFVIADRVRLGFWGELLYLQTWWAQQDQHFYGGPDAGQSYEGISTDIQRFSYMLGARLAVDF
jgi:hypothetical protein